MSPWKQSHVPALRGFAGWPARPQYSASFCDASQCSAAPLQARPVESSLPVPPPLALAGWPDFTPMPVLLLPAQQTLLLPAPCQGAGSDFTASPDCVSSLQQPRARCEAAHGTSGAAFNKCTADSVYGSLYAAYKTTLSSATTLFVLPGSHGFVIDSPAETVRQLLTKFAGV